MAINIHLNINNTINYAVYADDLATLFNKIISIQPQIDKIDKYCEWTGMGLGIYKCAIMGCPKLFYKLPL